MPPASSPFSTPARMICGSGMSPYVIPTGAKRRGEGATRGGKDRWQKTPATPSPSLSPHGGEEHDGASLANSPRSIEFRLREDRLRLSELGRRNHLNVALVRLH